MTDIRIPEQNYSVICGRLTRDPEYRIVQSGSGYCFFDVAVNRRRKDAATGEWKDDVTYVPVTAWSPVAERCKERLKKGSPVYVEGHLAGSDYVDKAGQKRRILKLAARRVQFLSVASSSTAGDGAAADAGEQSGPPAKESSSGGMEEVAF